MPLSIINCPTDRRVRRNSLADTSNKVVNLFFVSFIMATIMSLASSALAASASVTGSVRDAQTGEPLPGANVLLVGTSFGASTDLNGNFTIRDVPPATYTLRATYVGYKAKDTKVNVGEGATVRVNIRLEAVGIQGKEVVVTAQANGQNQAINQQLSSSNIVNVVSAARIQELPDANAAEALGRLPGMSVLRSGGEANEVVIRGIAPKYNRILINGVQVTSTNPNDASVDLSMISSNMLEGMEVKKTVTPDMDADVIGGTVNLQLREAHVKTPGVPVFGLLVQGGYNALSDAYNKTNNYKYVGSIEDRFFDDKFGVFVQGDVERVNLSSNELGASYTNLGNSLTQYLTSSLNLGNIPRDRRRYDGALVLDYRLPKGMIKFSNFFSTGITAVTNRGEAFSVPNNTNTYSINYSNSTLSVITDALHLEYQLPVFHVNAELSHSYTETKDPHDWTVAFQQGSAGLGGLINQANLDPHAVPKAANYDTTQTYLNSLQTFNSFSGARALTASLDLETNLNFSDFVTSVIKFGGVYRYETRKYLYGQTRGDGLGLASATYVDNLIISHFNIPSQYIYSGTSIRMIPFMDPNYSYGTFLGGSYPIMYPLNFGMLSDMASYLDNSIGVIAQNSDAITYSRDQIGSTTNNYNGREGQSAGYAMATVNFGPQFTVIGGVRYQNLQTTYTGNQGQENTQAALGGPWITQYDTTVAENHGYWLPDVSVRYKPLSWFDVRLSYTHTLAYPDFVSIIPRIDVPATVGGTISWNNTGLVPSRSTNYDLYFSAYDNSIGLVTLGGFLKHIYDLIYPWSFYPQGAQLLNYYPARYRPTKTPSGVYSIATYVNDPNRATDYGIEFDWETHFWYLPAPFNGLILDVNYTRNFSKEVYPYTTLQKIGRNITPVDTSYTDRLLYQPDNVVNLALGYDYKGFSVRVSMEYYSNRFNGPNFWPQLRTTESAYTRWDLSAKQDLPWYGLQLYGDLSNINSENDVYVIQAATGVPQSESDYGMTADLGLRVNF